MFFYAFSVVAGASLVANAKVQLLHALHLIAHVLQCTDGAVSGQTLKNMSKCAGDLGGFLCQLLHLLILTAGCRDKDDGGRENIGVLLC